MSNIVVKGARVNNLRGVDVEIERGKLTVITGLSGSGKSSLAFDTLYAEGQRRYVESLSAYARQFLGRMAKPEADYIKGLPPAIAIEQKVNTRNPRSTVGTATEIYDYLRLLFARAGHTISPVSGKEVKKQSVDDVVDEAAALLEGTRIAVAAPIVLPEGRTFAAQLDIYRKEGFSRLVDTSTGAFSSIEDILSTENPEQNPSLALLVDRMTAPTTNDDRSRLADSVDTAYFEGRDAVIILVYTGNGVERREYSKRFEADGISFIEPTDTLFNFNNPYGACPRCEGFGRIIGIDERLVVPNTALSVYDDAVVAWRGEKMSQWKQWLISVASSARFPIHKPYQDLTPDQLDFLWHGGHGTEFTGIDGFFKMVEENQYKIQYRVMMSRYRGRTICPECHGRRLRPEALYVRVNGKTIAELTALSINELVKWFDEWQPEGAEVKVTERLLKEIRTRLHVLVDVGLGYLTLDRLSSSLSGGESQRINLATSLGSSLVGSLYILDEPSIGLHSRDTGRLIDVLKRLRDAGNTVVIVEHDEEIMRAADRIVDVGPKAGQLGGRIVWNGATSEIDSADAPESYTVGYLTGKLSIPVPKRRRKFADYIEVVGAREHNLKNIDVKFPLGMMTAVTGVSGSGKSTLVRDILYRALRRHLGEGGDLPGAFRELRGDLNRIEAVEFVDQNPIGKSSRSNPATYLKAYDEIRKLFADTQQSKQMGFTPAYFSFNTEGGRCEECKGEGTVTIEMQFMADVTIPCESCGGKRFKREVLDVQYRGKNISDILDMTVDEAIEFFGSETGATEKRIVKRLQPLADVGLGYIKLGQSSSTLSGGENQRVKLAYFLGGEKQRPTMFIFDEPTTGLHFHDISKLMVSLSRLIEQGHTVVVIEHNLDVVKCADYVIDIGPEGGDRGGQLVAAGTPEQIAETHGSYTAEYLKEKLTTK